MKENVLKWYASETDLGTERGSILLSEYTVTNKDDNNPLCFSIVNISDPSKKYKLFGKSSPDVEDWMNSLKKVMKMVYEERQRTIVKINKNKIKRENEKNKKNK